MNDLFWWIECNILPLNIATKQEVLGIRFCLRLHRTGERITTRFDTTRMPTFAELRVHDGILFSSVKIENKSSAEAMNPASTVIVAVLTALAGVFTAGLGAVAGDAADDEEVAGAAEPGAGVPLRLGSALTVRSLP